MLSCVENKRTEEVLAGNRCIVLVLICDMLAGRKKRAMRLRWKPNAVEIEFIMKNPAIPIVRSRIG